MRIEKSIGAKSANITTGGKPFACLWGNAKTPVLRPAWAEIDLKSFKTNLRKIQSFIKPRTKIIAVVKANAYGHMALPLSETALRHGAWALGVSSIEEGIALREGGIKGRILILGSIFPLENLRVAAEYNLVPTISSLGGLAALSRVALKLKKKLPFHLKVDTGMGRIGVSTFTAPALLERVASKKEVVMEGIYTHFSAADCDERVTRLQMKKFAETIKIAKALGLKFIAHASNSAALIKHKDFQLDAVRPGVSLYGLFPFKGAEKLIKLSPVLSLKTKIVFLKRLPKGSPVSYGGTFVTKKRSVIATLPIGYADGFNRLLSNKGEVLIRGERCPVIGRVTMDMTMVDVTRLSGAAIGDEVVVIGSQGGKKITAEEIADKLGTINYEITCNISSRIPRVII
jgi:alanine racemase